MRAGAKRFKPMGPNHRHGMGRTMGRGPDRSGAANTPSRLPSPAERLPAQSAGGTAPRAR